MQRHFKLIKRSNKILVLTIFSSNFKHQTIKLSLERFPSGQREQTVNLSAIAFGGSNPPLSRKYSLEFVSLLENLQTPN